MAEKTGRKTGYVFPKSVAAHLTERIECAKLITRLTKHAMGELHTPMDPSQVQAAKILLDKSLSNAPQRQEVSGPDGGEIPTVVKVLFGAA